MQQSDSSNMRQKQQLIDPPNLKEILTAAQEMNIENRSLHKVGLRSTVMNTAMQDDESVVDCVFGVAESLGISILDPRIAKVCAAFTMGIEIGMRIMSSRFASMRSTADTSESAKELKRRVGLDE
jgi:hypothetical protein